MSQCYDASTNSYVYCTSNTSVYIAVAIVIPFVILFSNCIIFVCIRYKRKLERRIEHEQINMTTVVPTYNNDEQQQVPYNYSYPPQYTERFDSLYNKPPSYEQSVQQLSEINNTSRSTAAILPVTAITSTSTQLVQPSQPQT